jgi:phage shock protein C
MMSERKLYRSQIESRFLGVCGGLGNYFGIDPTLVRVFFVVFTLVEGFGILLYLLLALFMPVAPEGEDGAFEGDRLTAFDNPQAGNYLGIGLVALGGVMLLDNLDVAWLSWVSLGTMLPAALILLGLVLLVRSGSGSA